MALIVSNRRKAGVLDLAHEMNVPSLVVNRKQFYESRQLIEELEECNIDLIVLAGFLWLIPMYLIRKFHNRIVNIHPALLPKYGGKGMYGKYVHEAVWNAGDDKSGITIHLVNEHYDEGHVLFQAECELAKDDGPEEIADKVLKLEHTFYPKIVEKLLSEL